MDVVCNRLSVWFCLCDCADRLAARQSLCRQRQRSRPDRGAGASGAAHVAALQAIEKNAGLAIYNIGTGHGYSVLDVVNAFEKANGVKVPYSIKPRRPGDIATCYCDPTKAEKELGWKAQYGIEDMCRDSWNWQSQNPEGY